MSTLLKESNITKAGEEFSENPILVEEKGKKMVILSLPEFNEYERLKELNENRLGKKFDREKVKQAIKDLDEIQKLSTLGDDLTIRDLINEGRM